MATTEEMLQELEQIIAQREALGVSPQMTNRAFDYYANGVNHQSFSSENPYYQQMAWAKNLDDLKRLQTAAIEWEANRQALEDQRAYDDPTAQASRLRAAGINPDFEGGQGVSAGSSAEQAPVDLDTLSTPTEQANTVFNGLNVAVGALSAVTGAVTAGFELAKGISTFGDYLSMSSSAAEAAEAGAESAQSAASLSRLGLVGDIASMIPAGTEVTSEFALDYLNRLGVQDPEVIAPLLQEYSKSPQMQEFYQNSILAAREAKASQMAAPFDLLLSTAENTRKVQAYQAELSALVSQFEQSVGALVMTGDNVYVAAGTAQENLNAANNEAGLRTEKSIRDVEAFFARLDALKFEREGIDALIETYKKKPQTIANRSMLISALVHRGELDTLSSEQLDRVYQIVGSLLANQVNYETVVTNGHIAPGSYEAMTRYLDYNNFTWSRYLNSGSQGLKDDIFSVLDRVVKIGAGASRKGPIGALAGLVD